MRLLPPLLAALALLLATVAVPAGATTHRPGPTAVAADSDGQALDGEEEPAPDYEDAESADPGDDGAAAPPAIDEAPIPGSHGPVLAPSAPGDEPPPLVTTGTVPGRRALLRSDGRAAIPRRAPLRVRAIIAAANRIVGKRYKWGGGHARLNDSGYDCSGTVSYALIRSGELAAPLVSGSFARWGARGPGAYVTIYANGGHVYMEVAGLRLDTSAVADPGGRSGVRWRPAIGRRARFAVRHVPGL